jgi:site-specific recombinase XerD
LVTAIATRPIVTEGDLGLNAVSFARYLRASNLTPRTIKTYMEGVARLATFLTEQGLPTDLAAIKREHVESWIADILEHSKAATAANRYRSAQAFFKWAEGEHERDADLGIAVSPMHRMRSPKIPEERIEVLRVADVRRMIDACKGPRFEDRRDEALIRLMYSTGTRLAEAAALRWTPGDPTTNDVDLDLGRIRVKFGKGRREREISTGRKTALALDRYVRLRSRHRYASSDHLWLAAKGPLTYSGLAQAIRERGKQAGLGDHVHPHRLRHSWAHSNKAAGMSDADLMNQGGWRSHEMLRRYGQSAESERALAAGSKANPGDEL